jgi:hypothetical protein
MPAQGHPWALKLPESWHHAADDASANLAWHVRFKVLIGRKMIERDLLLQPPKDTSAEDAL